MYREYDVNGHLQCTPHIDAEVLAGLVPKLTEILKSGVGLGTKVCCLFTCLFTCLCVYMLVFVVRLLRLGW